MRISSRAFEDGETIPAEHTCDGEDISPPLEIQHLPDAAASLVLIVDDPDAPRGTWDHWVLYNIPPTNQIPAGARGLGVDGRNSWGITGYRGPCPPSGTHRYYFRLYALASPLGLPPGADKDQVLGELANRVLAEAVLMGRYGR